MAKQPDKRGQIQDRDRKGRFVRGVSGNPEGRSRGSRNRATIACESLLMGEGEALTRKAIQLALAGDTTALRLCLERLLPPAKDRPVSIKLPRPESAAETRQAMAEIIEAAGKGEITPGEARILASLIETHRRVLELDDIEARLIALEKHVGADK